MPILTDATTSDGPALVIAIKAVPGSSRDQIAGVLGERLKVKVAAPPEDGKANEAICRVVAKALGVAARAVSVASGHSRPEKTLRVQGVPMADAVRLLNL